MAIIDNFELNKLFADAIETQKNWPIDNPPLLDRDERTRLQYRKEIIAREDHHALERIVGRRDLQQINFLKRGLRAARAVCRVRIRSRESSMEHFGTGFLVAPGLLMTNRHVLPNTDVARHSLAEFDYEQDEHFVETTPRVFNFLPSDIYLSHTNLDVAFVAVASFAHDGTPLAEFGSLPLLQRSGKAINGEWVTLIQHPNGEPKQIVIRESQIVRLSPNSNLNEDMIAYTSDTERGSSG
ncbi:MAG: serine protease, partial [Pseudomonadota bacterium]